MLQALDRLKEAQLLQRIQVGDESAFIEAYDAYAPKIWKHAYFRTGAHEVADDILSDTFLRAWEFVQTRSKELKHLRAFLYRVANNLIIDHYRRNARAAISIDEELERVLGQDAEMDAHTDDRLASEQIQRALRSMRPDVRELLVMRYIDDLTIEEISLTVGKSKNAVYVALHRGVKELKLICSAEIISRTSGD